MAERIDAHHHLWRYSQDQYGWIGPGMEAIARDFLPAQLHEQLRGNRIDGCVAVQALQTIEETDTLLALADDTAFIRGVVGWAPIASPQLPDVFARWHGRQKLKGLRHIVQAEPDDQFILRNDFNQGISRLGGTGLVYDILIYEKHLPETIEFVDRHPNQIFVLDHIAKPRIKERVLEPWRSRLRELARRENVYCKLSGMVTEADWHNWTAADLQPFIETALAAFGPTRLMFGSDWPVCLLASSYGKWFETARNCLAGLSAAEKDLVFGEVATKIYSLGESEPAKERNASSTAPGC
jgi:L-fuconolactonase